MDYSYASSLRVGLASEHSYYKLNHAPMIPVTPARPSDRVTRENTAMPLERIRKENSVIKPMESPAKNGKKKKKQGGKVIFSLINS